MNRRYDIFADVLQTSDRLDDRAVGVVHIQLVYRAIDEQVNYVWVDLRVDGRVNEDL